MPSLKESHSDTYQKILRAAGEVFVEFGFQNATVREICKRAGANLAAVNYHFRDKESLYTEVLRHWARAAMDKYPPDLGVEKSDSPETRLRAFVRSNILRMLDEGQPSWFWKLVAREISEPTKALDMLVNDFIRPSFTVLSSIVRLLLGRQATEERIRLYSMSIVGQCLHFYNARHVISRLFQKNGYLPEDKEQIADHICRFSLDAIRHMPEIRNRRKK
jgi:AcrR family transcriptional regulator